MRSHRPRVGYIRCCRHMGYDTEMTQKPSHGHQPSREDPPDEHGVSPIRFIGCCGAYCRTCRVFRDGVCKGCKLEYDTGTRDITKAKCAMKVCCFKDRHLETCADCPEYPACERIQAFHAKKGYKYRKYRESIEFIRNRGYPAFLRFADTWNGAYGKLS
jgi:hypothetical protein